MNWSKMILTASMLVLGMILGQAAYAQAPAGKGNPKKEMNDKPAEQGLEKAKTRQGEGVSLEGDGAMEETRKKIEDRQAGKKGQAEDAEENAPKGKAYGKNKGELEGRAFGQERAKAAKENKNKAAKKSKGETN